jgi:hypothetical protein
LVIGTVGSGEPVCLSPFWNRVVLWAPFAHLNPQELRTILARETGLGKHSQGYLLPRFLADQIDYDNQFGDCSRPRFDALGGGIIAVFSHGNIFGNLIVVGCDSQTTTDQWIGKPHPELFTGRIDNLLRDANVPNVPPVVFGVFATESYLREQWSRRNDEMQAMVLLIHCNSGLDNTEHCGGRARFGFNDSVRRDSALNSVSLLLQRMNGTRYDASNIRMAGVAFDAGGYDPAFVMAGGEAARQTTLCPSVLDPAPGVNAWPWGPGAAREGRARVRFDTAIEPLLPERPENAVRVQHTEEVEVDDFRWITEEGRYVGIDFRYRTDCLGSFKVTVRVLANKVRSVRSDSQYLDGNDGRENQEEEGVAWSKDDFVWSFED